VHSLLYNALQQAALPLWACVQTLHAEPSSLAYELHAYDCTIMH